MVVKLAALIYIQLKTNRFLTKISTGLKERLHPASLSN
jgi:hypothetical protein